MSKKALPKLRHHKASGQAFVELNGHRHYLGKHGTPEAETKYHQHIAEWLAAGQQPAVPTNTLVIVELVSRYLKHADRYYRKPDGGPTSEVVALKYAVEPLLKLYSGLPCSEFTPKKLIAGRARDRHTAPTRTEPSASARRRAVEQAETHLASLGIDLGGENHE